MMINPLTQEAVMETINAEMVGQINTLVEAWNTADRRIRDMFHGWEQRATRAGLVRGFYIELAQLPGADTLINGEIEDMETAGRAVYAAYRAGGVTAALDEARA
jgi:hypothetical protein